MKRVPLSVLVKRINRKLSKKSEVLMKTRSDRWRSDLGDYYIVDTGTNTVQSQHIDPVCLAKELGVIGSARGWLFTSGTLRLMHPKVRNEF